MSLFEIRAGPYRPDARAVRIEIEKTQGRISDPWTVLIRADGESILPEVVAGEVGYYSRDLYVHPVKGEIRVKVEVVGCDCGYLAERAGRNNQTAAVLENDTFVYVVPSYTVQIFDHRAEGTRITIPIRIVADRAPRTDVQFAISETGARTRFHLLGSTGYEDGMREITLLAGETRTDALLTLALDGGDDEVRLRVHGDHDIELCTTKYSPELYGDVLHYRFRRMTAISPGDRVPGRTVDLSLRRDAPTGECRVRPPSWGPDGTRTTRPGPSRVGESVRRTTLYDDPTLAARRRTNSIPLTRGGRSRTARVGPSRIASDMCKELPPLCDEFTPAPRGRTGRVAETEPAPSTLLSAAQAAVKRLRAFKTQRQVVLRQQIADALDRLGGDCTSVTLHLPTVHTSNWSTLVGPLLDEIRAVDGIEVSFHPTSTESRLILASRV